MQQHTDIKIGNPMNNKQNRPLSFVSTVAAKIDVLLESLKSQSGNTFLNLSKNSESIHHLKEQVHKWKQETQSQIVHQTLSNLEQKLSKATELNSKLFEKKSNKISA